MPDSKITALASIGTGTDPVNDALVIVDVSDVSPGGMSATGTTKRVSLNNLLASSPTATLASATITGDLTVDTSTLKVDSANNRVGVLNASPGVAFHIGTTGGTNRFAINTAFTSGGDIQLRRGAFIGFSNAADSGNSEYLFANAGALDFGINGSTAMTLNSTGLGVGIVPSSFGRFSVQGTAVSAGILGMNTDATRCDIQSYNVPLAINRAGNNITMCEGGGNVGIGVAPSAWGSAFKVVQTGQALGVYGRANLGYYGTKFNLYNDNTNDVAITTNYVGEYRFQLLNGSHVWLNKSSAGTAGANQTLTQAMTLDASGRLLVGPTSANASGGVLQLSSGITFPATQVASSDANTLDDYEEGTWTGTLKGSVSDPTTPVTATGKYTKIGRQVFVEITYNGVNTTGASGNISVTGLPFSCGSNVNGVGTTSLNQIGTFTGSPYVFLSQTTSVLELYGNVSAGAGAAITHNAGTLRYMTISMTYTV